MDKLQKAEVRRQLADLVEGYLELNRDLRAVEARINRLNELKKVTNKKDTQIIVEHLSVYLNNKMEIKTTIEATSRIIKELKDTVKPSSYFKI